MNKTHLSETRFADLALHPKLQQALSNAGFEYCTPIQALSLPVALSERDVATVRLKPEQGKPCHFFWRLSTA